MKKLFVLVLSVVLVLSLSSCAEVVVIERGVVEESVYTSETSGISVSIPEGWTFNSDEEIAELLHIPPESFDFENADKYESLYDMRCINPDSGANINVTYKNMELIYDSIPDEEEYLQTVKGEMGKTMGEYLKGLSLDNVEIDGEEFLCLKVTLDYAGAVTEQKILVKKIDRYMAVITLSAFSESDMEDMLEYFSVK